MHYRIAGGRIVQTENAAKPVSQKSMHFSSILNNLLPVGRTLDYGCGKLRYFEELKAKSDELYVTDSDIQLYRRQMLLGYFTSVLDLLGHRNDAHVVKLQDFGQMRCFFDRVILANVLQIIPMLALRSIIVRRIFRSLRVGGELIAVVQYRNSDFNRMKCMPNSWAYLDGMAIRHCRGTSFYSFISPHGFRNLIASQGF